MRKIALLLFFTIVALAASAQELTVKRFEETNALTARQYPRLDANQQPCALVKVEVVAPITKAEGGVVGDIVDHSNEKWVYIIAQQREFKLYFANYLPVTVRTADYGYHELEANTTYVLRLVDENAAAQSTTDTGKQYLVMTVKPTDAMVLLDGTVRKLDADGSLMVYLPYGQHSYRVLAEGYKEQSGEVTVGRERSELNVSLTSTKATLSVTCPTAAADIYINGNRMGSGSWRGQLAAGTYSLEAKHTGYKSVASSVTLAENEERTVELLALVPIYGALNVNYSPVNSEVWLDGKQLGQSPNVFHDIAIGSHRVEIKKSGYENKTLNVTVAENQTADLSGSLTKLAASSSVSSSSSNSSGVSGDAIRTFEVNGVSLKMVRVDGGTFMMGANESDNEAFNNEKPRHQVTLSSYYIGQTEVTQDLWKAVMGSNPSKFEGDDLPVEQVSWNDCQTFIDKLNALTGQQFSLPTEAEWEYAARGGNKSRGYKYSGSDNIDAVMWYNGKSGYKTQAVATKQPNELGIYDMTGNVWEWCSDWYYGKYSSTPQMNPTGPSSGSYRVERGGGWNSSARGSRVSYRNYFTPTNSYSNLGLRLSIHNAR